MYSVLSFLKCTLRLHRKMKCCHGNLVSSCEVVSGYADHDNNNDTQKNANEYNDDGMVMYVISRT